MPKGGAGSRSAVTRTPVRKSKAEVLAARISRRDSDARWSAMTELSRRTSDTDAVSARDMTPWSGKDWIEAWCPVCPNPMMGECKPSAPVPFDLADQCDHAAVPAFFAHRSLCCLLPENRLRKVAVWLATWKWFDRGVLALIALNTLLLTITDFSIVEADTLSPARVGTATAYPFESGATSAVNTFNFYIEYFFTVAFTFEMLTKMVAMGVICEGHGTYLRDYWNWIDLTVVLSAWFQMVPGLPSVVFLRVVRVLRPLRSLNSVPRLKALIEAILGAMPQLLNILVLILLMFLIFGILGIQLFVGVQHHHCRHTELPLRMPNALAEAYDADMSQYVLGEASLETLPFLASVLTNRTAFPFCAPTYALDGEAAAAPFALDNDNVKSWASSPWNTARECVWPHVVEVDRVCSPAPGTATMGQYVYRCPSSGGGVSGNGTTHCGSNYDDFGNRRFADWKAQRSVMWNEGALSRSRSRSLCLWRMHDPSPLRGCPLVLTLSLQRSRGSARRAPRSSSSGTNFGITNFDDILHGFVTIFQCITLEGWVDVMYMYADGAGWTIAPIIFVLMIIMGSFFLLNLTLAVLGNHFDSKMAEVESERILRAAQTVIVNKIIVIYRRRMKQRRRAAEIHTALESQEQGDGDDTAASTSEGGGASSVSTVEQSAAVFIAAMGEDAEGKDYEKKTRKCAGDSPLAKLSARVGDGAQAFIDKVAAYWNADLTKVWCQRCAVAEGKGAPGTAFSIACAWPVKLVHAFVEHWLFQTFIICCILLNSVTLSLDVYPPEPLLESILEYINFFLTVVFILEMGLKLYGLGLRIYLHDGFNIFDAVIVGASILETAVAPPSFFGFPPTGDSGFGGLTALRTFRVFRLFKLARSWKALQQILATIVRALQSGVYFLMLLMLFVLIYALVGQQFFANRLHFDATTLDALHFKDIPPRYAGVTDAWSTDVEKAYAVAQVDATIYTPRSNFDTLSHAIFTIVQVLSGENWNVLLYDCWRAVDPVAACAYLFSLVCIGSFVLLDFFLAILLNDFEKSAALAKEQDEKERADREQNGMSQTIVSRFQRWLDAFVARAWVNAVVCVDAVSDKAECGCCGGGRAESDGDDANAILSVADAVLHASPTLRKKRTPEEQSMKAMIMLQSIMRRKRAKARLEGLRRRALFRGENVRRVVEDPVPIRLEGGRVCFCFGRRARVFVAALIERSAADCRCFRLREGDTVVTDLEHCGGILDTTHARILRVHNNDDVAIGTRFDIETLTWSYKIGSTLLSTYGRSELTFKELRQLLPRDITDDDFNRLCALADEDNSKTIDGRELGILLESVRGIEVRGLSQSQLKWEFFPFAQSLLRAITFDNFILILIFISSAMLAIESPLWDPNSERPTVMKWLDFGINILFTLEIVLKVIAYGVLRRKSSYLRNWWNVGDFAIVIISWSTFALSEVKELKALRSVRLLRVLRTLRSINKLPGLKRVVQGLLLSIVPLTSVLPVILLIFLIFAIVLTSSLKGALSHCTGDAYDALSAFQQALIYDPVLYADLNAEQKAWGAGDYSASPGFDAITSKPVCEWLGGEWERKVAQSFDNTLLSFSALTQLSTTEGWTDVAFAAVDSRGMEMQPNAVGGAAEEVWLFGFIVFEAVGAFFLVNLFIGILIVTFAAAKAARERDGEEGSSFLMTHAQQVYMKQRNSLEEELKPMHAIRMLEPRLPLQKFFYDVVENWGATIELPLKCLCVLRCATNCPKASARRCCGNFYRILQCVDCKSWCGRVKVALNFDTIIFSCIIANTVVMAITYFGEPDSYSMTLNIFNWAFALIFTVEAALKLVAFGTCGYFMQPWNTFDFVIVLGTAIGLAMSVGKETGVLAIDIDIGPAATVIRSFRIARMIRLVRFARQLRVIVDTLISALPAMLNVSLLVALVFFIYTVIGVQVFAKVGFRGEALNEHANFMNFQNGFLTLFRCATGEAWPDLMCVCLFVAAAVVFAGLRVGLAAL